MSVFQRVHMPSLDGATGWVKSDPPRPAELRGHVVLVNFWTLTCINWVRQEPYVRAWSQAYRDDGLLVVGVHTPEFSFEHDIDGVRQAVEVRDIGNPVAQDNDYAVWSAFANHYWPALYFVDKEGVIRDQHSARGATRNRSASSSACSASSASSSPSKGGAWRPRRPGTTCLRPRPISARRAVSGPRHRTACP
jgi:thiol-disulfide isomerase/thioredoxin